MAEAAISLLLSLIVIYILSYYQIINYQTCTERALNLRNSLLLFCLFVCLFVCLQTSAMAAASISLMLYLIVIITIYVSVLTDISHGRGRHQPAVIINCN